jgi:nucleotide-binding universal stress UspA family protein
MTEAGRPPRRVLAVLGGGPARTALLTAAALADRHGAALEAIGCIGAPPDMEVIARLSDRSSAHLLDDLCGRVEGEMRAQVDAALPDREVALRIAVGKPFVEIVRHVIAAECDFVVKVSEPLTGLHKVLFASTDQHLLRKCPCPVWLQTEDASPVPRRVLAAVDVDDWDAAEPETLDALNRRVIATARAVAGPTGAEVVVLHAWEAASEGMAWAFSSGRNARLSADTYVNEILATRHRAMDRLIAGMSREGVRLVPRLSRGAPERVIDGECATLGADVVVMGTVARTGLSGVFIGNTAENVINSLEHPVIAVKPDGFVSPLQAR